MYRLLKRNAHPLPAPVNGNWITSSHCLVAGVMPLHQVSCEAGHLWVSLSPRFMFLTVKIPCVYSKTSCMPDTFRKVCARVCCRSSKSWPTEIINPGLGRQITRYHIKWFFLVFLYLFSIHQKNMYMPSTAAPKPCPTLVQNAGPKIWTIFRQKWQKKSLTLLGGTHLFSRTTEANRLPNNILLC